jgi:predicted transposase/invertase (TIGR01784 family)
MTEPLKKTRACRGRSRSHAVTHPESGASTVTINRKNDYAFKRIFGHEDTKDILAKFLSDILGKTIAPDELTLVNTELSPEFLGDKTAILDIQVSRIIRDGKEKYDVEIQNSGEGNIVRRVLSYLCRAFVADLKSGMDYGELPRVVSVVIADFDMVRENRSKFHSVFEMRERESNILLDDALEVHILELPKLDRRHPPEEVAPDERWGLYLDNTEGEVMDKIAKQEPMIARALTIAEIFALDEKERYRYEMREKSQAVRRGIEKYGIEIGEKRGEKRGAKRMRIAIVRKMLKRNRPIDEIVEDTGMSRAEIEKLRS